MRPDPAPHRIGQPSPLIFHFGAALATYAHALMAAPRADSPSFPWAPGLTGRASEIGRDLDQIEIACEIAARLHAMLAGIEAWQRHPWRRRPVDLPEIWKAGCSRLVDYGAAPEATDPHGPPVLVIPSLINRAHVLDLLPERSALRHLAARGLRPVLLEWGDPGPDETRFGLEDYAALRLAPAMAALRADAGRPVHLVGYCMGGTLLAGFAARAPDGVASLVTIGAPWDFASTGGIAGGMRAMIRAEGADRAEQMIAAMGAAFGAVPVSLFQSLFALVNPLQVALKFSRFSRLDPDGSAARLFVALEDWLADGVAMPAPAARDLLIGWQIRNEPAQGRWRLLGGRVDPAAIGVPVLTICGQRDSIAPPPLAEPLAAAVPGATCLRPRAGHVGMVVGTGARASVLEPLAGFLHAHSG